jgi:hypothetical protein
MIFGTKWEPGTATIVAVHVKSTSGDGMVTIKEFAVDVTPESGEPFRALVQEPRIATNFWAPGVGNVVRVEIDPKGLQVRFDKSDPQINAKGRVAGVKSEFEATLAQPVGSGPAGGSVKDRAEATAIKIAELKARRDAGELSDEDYQSQSRALIAGL